MIVSTQPKTNAKLHLETIAVHAGVEPDPVSGAVMTPIYQTSTYAQADVAVHKGYEYSRTDNPTRTALQTALAALRAGGMRWRLPPAWRPSTRCCAW